VAGAVAMPLLCSTPYIKPEFNKLSSGRARGPAKFSFIAMDDHLVSFDEEGGIRILDSQKFQEAERLQEECTAFTTRM